MSPFEFTVESPPGFIGDSVNIMFVTTTGTLREVGFLNASSGGSMLVRRVLHDDIVLTDSKAYRVEIEWKVVDV